MDLDLGKETLHKVPMDRVSFYQVHLEKVSRSFAFCIAELKAPLREWIGLSYILCRLVDTVEDSQWSDKSKQLEAFERFGTFLIRLPNADELKQWQMSFPDKIPVSEKELIQDSGAFFADLHALDERPKQILQKTISNMTRGMKHFSRHAGDQLRLETRIDANQYCFFVAGVIGELLTELVALVVPEMTVSERLLIDSFHFGLYLQKINLLKDQATDQTQGRYLVFSHEQMLNDLKRNARRALEYLKAIPTSRSDYRLFCGWSLFLGLISIPWIEKSWVERNSAKISRTETFLFLAKVQVIINDNAALEELFTSTMSEEVSAVDQSEASGVPAWLTEAYRGELTGAGMQELGLT